MGVPQPSSPRPIRGTSILIAALAAAFLGAALFVATHDDGSAAIPTHGPVYLTLFALALAGFAVGVLGKRPS
jgi:hypothetical protein